MKITAVNNQINKRPCKNNVSKPAFKGVGTPEYYAIEMMKIYNSQEANNLIGVSKKLLPVKEVREFVAGFLRGVKNSEGTGNYEKESIFRLLSYNFSDFIYKDGWYFRTEEEELNAHKPKCSFSDIADKKGVITESAMDAAKKLAKARGSDHYLRDYLAAAKDADGSIDSSVGYKVADLIERVGDWDLKRIMQYKIYRDEKGNVNRDLLEKIYHAPKDKTWYTINHYGLKTADEVFKEHATENLYLPENYYKLLQNLNENRLIYSNDASIMYKEIGDYGKLLFILPDIQRTEENKEFYDKIIKFLLSTNTYEYDFNQKDKNGISFMEKVINSENPELINFVNKMKKKDLIWYPELDWAVNGIQNNEFKGKLKELDFKFEALEKAAQLRSTLALRKLTPQFDSPLCDKEKMILHIWDIAKKQDSGMDSKKEFGRYLCTVFIDDISEDTMFKIMNEGVNESKLNITWD
jgi:hypothetical protein